uniref:Nuclear pore complex protein Nup98-Nup96 n=1 Tax=Ixodes ricinus TaxID=34613 RepID=V5GJ92_IXORI
MFGATSTACGQLLPQFGLFGATATPTGGGLFGQPQSTGLFGQTATPTARSGLFGTSAVGVGLAGWGTIRKFKALTGTEFTTKDWEPITINFSLQCITCMKEYENKSLEELRLEDYAANRKGGQAGMVGFGATTQQSSIFSAPVSQQSAFNFGANQNKLFFGTSNTGMFPLTGGSIFGQNTQTKTTGFGLPAQPFSPAFSTGMAFGTGSSVLGQTQQKPLFGQPAATGLFGQTATTTQPLASTGFGTDFGAATQANAFGGKPPLGVTELYKTKVVCVRCSAEIQGREQPIHCSGTCQRTYHRKCMNVGPTESEILMQGGSGAFKCPTCTCRSAEDGRPLPHSSGDCTVSSGAIAGENESDRASTSETSKDENVQTTNDLVQQLLSMVDNLTNEVGCLKMECQTLRQQLGVTGTGSSALDRADSVFRVVLPCPAVARDHQPLPSTANANAGVWQQRPRH